MTLPLGLASVDVVVTVSKENIGALDWDTFADIRPGTDWRAE